MPRFLIVDGYDKPARDALTGGGCTHAGELYHSMLTALAPGAETQIVMPGDGDSALPAGVALTDFDGITWTGSSLTIHKVTPAVQRQVDFARAAFKSGTPQFGSCWAAQIATVAAGGQCGPNPQGREFGAARKIYLTDAGRAHPLFAGRAPVFDGFTSHYDIVTALPPRAELLASNSFTEVQALTVDHDGGSFWAVQYHPEYSPKDVADLARLRTDSLIEDGHFADAEQAARFVDEWTTLATAPDRLDLAWVHGLEADLLDPAQRWTEVKNWIDAKIPRAQ
jgi:GMP synthase (glutamine-hydrolysing)